MWFKRQIKFPFKCICKKCSWQESALRSLLSLKPPFSLELCAIAVQRSSSVLRQAAQKARHQYLIWIQGSLQPPSSASWSGQLHSGVGAETVRKDQNRRCSQVVVLRGNLQSTASLRRHQKDMKRIRLKISKTPKK